MYGTQCNDIISNIVFIRMFFTLFSNRMISFFTLQCELFTSCNVSNNASLVSAWTGGGGSQSNVDRPRQGEEGVPKIPKFVRTSFTDDPYLQKQLLVGVFQSRFSENLTIFTEKHLYRSLFFIKLQAWRPVALLKRDPNTGEICESFKNIFFDRTPLVLPNKFRRSVVHCVVKLCSGHLAQVYLTYSLSS